MARVGRHRAKKTTAVRHLTAAIREIAAAGEAVAVVDGAKIYVPLAAPGDVALIEARGERGTLIELLEKSRFRAPPPCAHYGACGGCALQHVTREFYRGWKRQRIIDALSLAGISNIEVAETMETPAASRRRAVFAARREGRGLAFGFNERRSERIVDVEACVVLHPKLAARLPALKTLAAAVKARAFDLSATLCDNGLDIVILAKGPPPFGPDLDAVIAAAKNAGAARLSFNDEPLVAFEAPIVRFEGISVSPPPGAFLQASKEGETALISLVREASMRAKKIADLFSGCGTFALPLAKDATVTAFDSDGAAIGALSDAAAGAQRAGEVNPVRAEVRDLFERPLAANELKAFDAAVFDPPRAGAAAQAAEIAKSGVPTVVGVSCSPATFSRDAAILARGGYALSQVTPVDQFVYSPHVELVGVFRKK